MDNIQTFTSKKDQQDAYRENGFLIAPDAFDAHEIKALCDEAVAVLRGQRGAVGGWSGVHDGQSDEEVISQYLCIHFPHKISQLILSAICHPVITEILTSIIGPNVKCMQSMLFIKSAGKPGQAWHQDEYFIPTRDRSLTGAWIALDDATIDNGCLWVIPGSHKSGVLWPQRSTEGDDRFDCSGESTGHLYKDEDAIPVEVKAGSVVFFNGYLLHRSLPNIKKAGFRRALVNHYMSAESLLPWQHPGGSVPMGTLDFRDIVMVAGNDPYSSMPIEDHSLPHIRPTGEGGCLQGNKDDKAFQNK